MLFREESANCRSAILPIFIALSHIFWYICLRTGVTGGDAGVCVEYDKTMRRVSGLHDLPIVCLVAINNPLLLDIKQNPTSALFRARPLFCQINCKNLGRCREWHW
jgi:hypothetical protein